MAEPSIIDNNFSDSQPDEELVKLTLKDQDNFLYLVKRYEKKLLHYVLRITNVRLEEAEDILQECFIKVYTNLNAFDTSLKFSSWVYRICHNQAISYYRHLKSRPQIAQIDVEAEILQLATEFNVDKNIDIAYLRQIINKVLGRLDLKYREVLTLKYLEDRSYQEMSDILKKPQGTIATLLNRAKEQFKKELIQQNIKINE